MTSNTNLNEKWYETEVGHGIISKKYFHEGETTFDQMAERISACFSLELKDKVKTALYNADFFPGGRSLYALGCKGKFMASPSNCYILPTPSDNIESIFDTGKQMARIFSRGGGTGINLSNLRPRGAKVNNVARTSTGAVSFMEIYNTIGGVISQNGRRGALLIGLNINHPDIEEFVNVKQNNTSIQSANISVLIDDQFMEAVKNNSMYSLTFSIKDDDGKAKGGIIKEIDARKFFEKICASNLDFAEPGIIFKDRVDEWHLLAEDFEYKIDICNPCLTYDMRILTPKGYKEIGSLVGDSIQIINKDGDTVNSKIWCSGEKEIVNLVSKTKEVYLKCTPDHRFMTTAGETVYAKEIKGHRLMPYIRSNSHLLNKEYVKYGFLQGDGQLSRLNSQSHNGLEVNIGKDDKEIASLFELTAEDFQSDGRKAYLTGYNDKLIKLGFDAKILPEREFPSKYSDFSVIEKLSFLRGCFSANGSVIKGHRVSYKTTCETLANQIADALMTFGIDSYLTCNWARDVKFTNGTYTCKKSFDVNITTYKSIKLFAELIGFEQQYKQDKLMELLIKKSPALYCKITGKTEKVYDFTEPNTHWGIVEGFVTHNCGEFFGSEFNSCNLGSINLYNLVDNPFTADAAVSLERLAEITTLAVKALDEILDYGYDLQPLDENRENIMNYRSIGLGIFGLADMLVALGKPYGSKDSIRIAERVMSAIFNVALQTSNDLAIKKGAYKKWKKELPMPKILNFLGKTSALYESIQKYGLRNSTLISIAPTGSIGTMSGLSGGMEPLFKCFYNRSTHTLVKENKFFKVYAKSVKDLLIKNSINPEEVTEVFIKEKFPFILTAHDISPRVRVEMQGCMQTYVDNAISSTVNMPKGTTLKEVVDIYKLAWEKGCKGLTVFVDGCKRTSILNEEPVKETKVEEVKHFNYITPIKRDDIIDAEEGLDGKSYRGSTACVPKLYTQVNHHNGNIFEVFTNVKQGCTSNIATITSLASLALRSGVKVEEIIKELKGNQCAACQNVKKSGKKVANSCGACIGEALEKQYNEIQSEKFKFEGLVKESIQKAVAETVAKVFVKNAIVDFSAEPELLPCPDCGEKTLRPEGKCNICSSCGYSRCS